MKWFSFTLLSSFFSLGCSSSPEEAHYWQDPQSIHPEAVAYQVKGIQMSAELYGKSPEDSITLAYIAYLDSALMVDPKYELALAERAKSYLSLGMRERAKADYRRMIQLNADHPYPKILLGAIHLEDGDSVRGEALTQEGYDILEADMIAHPDSVRLKAEYIAVLLLSGKREEARELLKTMPLEGNDEHTRGIIERIEEHLKD